MWSSVTDLGRRQGTPLEGTAAEWWRSSEPLNRLLAELAAEWWVAELPTSQLQNRMSREQRQSQCRVARLRRFRRNWRVVFDPRPNFRELADAFRGQFDRAVYWCKGKRRPLRAAHQPVQVLLGRCKLAFHGSRAGELQEADAYQQGRGTLCVRQALGLEHPGLGPVCFGISLGKDAAEQPSPLILESGQSIRVEEIAFVKDRLR